MVCLYFFSFLLFFSYTNCYSQNYFETSKQKNDVDTITELASTACPYVAAVTAAKSLYNFIKDRRSPGANDPRESDYSDDLDDLYQKHINPDYDSPCFGEEETIKLLTKNNCSNFSKNLFLARYPTNKTKEVLKSWYSKKLKTIHDEAVEVINKLHGSKNFRNEAKKIEHIGNFSYSYEKRKKWWKKLFKKEVSALENFASHVRWQAHALMEEIAKENDYQRQVAFKNKQETLKNLKNKFSENHGRGRLSKRIEAIENTLKNPYKTEAKEFYLNEYAQAYVQAFIPPEILKKSCGTEAQLNIHQEIVDVINKTSTLSFSNPNNFTVLSNNEIVLGATNIALEYKQKEKYDRAYSFVDLCWGLFDTTKDYAVAAGKGFVIGIDNFSKNIKTFVDCFMYDPIKATGSVANGILQLLRRRELQVTKLLNQRYGVENAAKIYFWDDMHRQAELDVSHENFKSAMAHVANFLNNLKENPKEIFTETVALTTETLAHFALWDIGITKVKSFVDPLVAAIKTNAALMKTEQQAVTAGNFITTALEESTEISKFSMQNKLQKSAVKNSIKVVNEFPELIEKSGSFHKATNSLAGRHDILPLKKISRKKFVKAAKKIVKENPELVKVHGGLEQAVKEMAKTHAEVLLNEEIALNNANLLKNFTEIKHRMMLHEKGILTKRDFSFSFKATAKEMDILGEAWVGRGAKKFKTESGSIGFVKKIKRKDGTVQQLQYRKATTKPYSNGKKIANFEIMEPKLKNSKRWSIKRNGHLDLAG
jgi:hypothetical protein